MSGEGSHFRVEEGIQGRPRVGKVFRKFSHNPGGGIQHLTDAIIVDVPGEKMSVLQDGGLE